MNKKIYTAFFAALFLLAAATAAQAVPFSLHAGALPPFAQKVFLDGLFGRKTAPKQAMPDAYYINDDKTFDENTSVTHMRPYNNPILEFDVRLPNHWTAEDLTKNQMTAPGQDVDQRLVGNVVKISSEMIGVNRVTVSVLTQTVKQDISAQNWLKNYIFTNGYALQGEVEGKGPRQAAAYFNSTVDQLNYYSYMTVYVTGNMVFICRADVPLQLKTYTAYIQKKVLDTLQLSYPKDVDIESAKKFTLVDAISFSYPVSWQPTNPDFKDMTHLSVQLQSKDIDGSINGFIRVLAVRRMANTSLLNEVDLLKKHFADYLKIDVNSLASTAKLEKVPARFIFSRYEVYKAAYKKEGVADPEVRLIALGDKDWYVFVYLITPREQDNLVTWGHNLRTMDIILASMR